MNTPFESLQDKIIVPINTFQKKYLSKSALHKVCKKTANFIFNYSKETALIMLGFNAISIISSHLSQISGLKKSHRENKDYLITQERHELLLDLLFTVLPSFYLNNALKKKLEGGTLTTKEARDKLINLVAPVVGVAKDELYSTDYIVPVRETIMHGSSNIIEKAMLKFKNMPIGLSVLLRRFNNLLKSKLPDYVTKFPSPSLEDITTDFDNLNLENKIGKNILSKLKNGSAYDELYNLNTGLLVITNIAYTILASNLLMPIIKNKLSNRSYEKQLAKMGETRESIKRKKHYEFTYHPIQDNLGNPVSDLKNKNLFKTFEFYSNNKSQSSGLRI